MTESPPPPATRIQAENRKAILEAALTIFSARGFKAASVEEIARACGMSKTNLLYYFRRKEDIYRAVLEGTLDAWLDPFAALDPSGDPEAELRRYILAKMRLSAERPEDSRLFANEVLHGAPVIGPFLRGPLRDLVARKAGILAGWMDEGRLARVDPAHLVFLIWAATQHYADFETQVRAVLPEASDRPDFHDSAAEAVLSIILKGVLPR